MQKSSIFKTKGMQRDLSEYSFNPEYAYENMNMRVFPTDSGTLWSLVNERGNKKLDALGIDEFDGVPLGSAVLENKIILFASSPEEENIEILTPYEEESVSDINAGDTVITEELSTSRKDIIYKFWIENNVLKYKELYRGNLGFDYTHPIETLCYSENSAVQKVYWTDGINYPRVINIEASDEVLQRWNDDSFNFRNRLKLQEYVSVEKLYGNGMFNSGTIQYVFTYFNQYSQESNIFNVTPIYYISQADKAGSPEDTISNSFKIWINDVDNSFEYLRIYSIFRSSPNVITMVKKVVDIKLNNNIAVEYIDNNMYGEAVDFTHLLYVGGDDVIFGTMTQKDNVLFVGDVSIKRPIISSSIKEKIRNLDIHFSASDMDSYIGDRTTRIVPEDTDLNHYYLYKSQLHKSSNDIKGFKYLETYRFGLQFQYYTGQWSEPVFVKDLENNVPINTNYIANDTYTLPYALMDLDLNNARDSEIVNYMVLNNYIAVRPIVVFPSLGERSCVCQGVVCPTVFNKHDRETGECMSQSSWFSRPNAPFKLISTDTQDRDDSTDYDSINSRRGITHNEEIEYEGTVLKGAFATFRHYYSVGGSSQRNGEIQCNSAIHSVLDLGIKDTDYFVDQSIVTLHSPDIEFNENITNLTNSLKFRIVGIIPITASASNLNITTSIPPIEPNWGFLPHPIINNNFSRFGYRGTINGIFWKDSRVIAESGLRSPECGFVIYPFHKTGAINGVPEGTGASQGSVPLDRPLSSVLKSKNLINLRYSFNTSYLPNNYVYHEDRPYTMDISDVKIFNALNSSLLKLKKPLNSGYCSDITYRGNIDTLITPEDKYYVGISANINNADYFQQSYIFNELTLSDGKKVGKSSEPIKMRYNSSSHAVLVLDYKGTHQQILPCLSDAISITNDFPLSEGVVGNITNKLFWENTKVTDVINQGTIKEVYVNNPEEYEGHLAGYNENYNQGIRGEGIEGISPEYGYLWLGELYRDTPATFGGIDENAIEQNAWLIAGKTVPLLYSNGTPKENIHIRWTEGDTYYQRYDHLKTYSPTLEEENGITEIISFMCETRINIDGRYDTHRGTISDFTINNTNFNRLNTAYTQDNNYFTYRSSSSDKINLNEFSNTILWSNPKISGDLIDAWTSLSFASTLDLDGYLGKVNSLQRVNNNIIAFQDKGISQILYNENVQIAATNGIPIELANSGRVSGKRYISNLLGCQNKWTIKNTQNGLYFLDNYTKSLYLFNGEFKNISNFLGFHTWFATNIKDESWNSLFDSGYTTLYDNVDKDLYLVSKDKCLGFSENIGQFSSFFNYENTPYLCNINDKSIMVKVANGKFSLWEQHTGEYNEFFGQVKPFYTTVIANQDPTKDKIFNTVEFRSDTFDKESNGNSTEWKLANNTFDELLVENEYQSAQSNLTDRKNRVSNLKKKFRIWRANIPRNQIADSNGKGLRDRIRNPWTKITLKKNNIGNNPYQKTILNDIVVHYFD